MTADENSKALSELENDEASDVKTPEELKEKTETSADAEIDTENDTDEIKDEDEEAPEEEEAPDGENDGEDKKIARVRAPIIIAACLIFASILFFVLWGFFFSQNSKIGVWQYSVSVGEGENKSVYTYTLSLEKDNVCRYNMGGTTYIGKYTSRTSPNGTKLLNIVLTRLGREAYNNNFNYNITGSLFTGGKLILTDIDGLILTPDAIDSENSESVETKKKLADSTVINGVRYYRIPFEPVSSIKPQLKAFDEVKTDDLLTGTWYEKNSKPSLEYTFTFNKDGTYEILYDDINYVGYYSAEDGICKYNLVAVNGSVAEDTIKYSFDEDSNLILVINDQESKLVKTKDKYAFKHHEENSKTENESSAESSAETSTESSAESSAESSTESSAETSTESSAETSTESSAESSTESSAESSAETSAESSAESSTDESTESEAA